MVASIELDESDAGCNIQAVVTENEALHARVLELTRLLTTTQGRSAAVERHLEQKADSLLRRNESLTQQLAETRGKLNATIGELSRVNEANASLEREIKAMRGSTELVRAYRKDSHKTQRITASDNLAVEDHYKVVEDQCSDVEMFNAEDPDIHDSITKGTHSQRHRSIGDEKRSAKRGFTAKDLHKDIKMLRRQLPDSPEPKKRGQPCMSVTRIMMLHRTKSEPQGRESPAEKA